MKQIEVLAPAGNRESLEAAILGGADAIYLGGKSFGARSFAGNFSNEELVEAITFAHLYGVKIYVTANTLLYEEEVAEFLEYIDFLHKNNVDAVIMQDIGMIDLVRKTYPKLPIHASTQLHIHNLEGVKVTEHLGLSRVVLARETSLEQIKEIKKNSSIELEIFVHGALCISYSGQCIMSSMIGGRSGNRGSCAQSCRQAYEVIDEKGKKVNKDSYVLSTKDLNILEHIEQLLEVGVSSLKIEGRMKRPEYVYLVVSMYRKAVDSYLKTGHVKITEEDKLELAKIFNRKFTKGFLFEEDNEQFTNDFRPNHLGIPLGTVLQAKNGQVSVKLSDTVCQGDGIRILGDSDFGLTLTKIMKQGKQVEKADKGDIITFYFEEEIKPNQVVLKTTDVEQMERIGKILKYGRRKVALTGKATLQINKPMVLEVQDGTHTVVVEESFVEQAKSTPITKERVEEQIQKLGTTVYEFTNLQVIMDDNIFVNVKDINEMRRKAIELLNQKRIYSLPYEKNEYTIDLPDFEKTQFMNIGLTTKEQYEALKQKNIHEFYVEDRDLWNQIQSDKRAILRLPRVISSYNKETQSVLIGEFGGVLLSSDARGDVFLNVTNSYSVALLHSLGIKQVAVSYELDYQHIKELVTAYENRYQKHPNLEVMVYGREEVMISKFNLLEKYHIQSNGYLKDRFKNQYPILLKNGNTVIYNYQIKHDKNDYFSLGINAIRYQLLEEKLDF